MPFKRFKNEKEKKRARQAFVRQGATRLQGTMESLDKTPARPFAVMSDTHQGPDYPKFATVKEITTNVLCDHLAQAGFASVSEQSFNFEIDCFVWNQYFSHLGDEAPEGPWMPYYGSDLYQHVGRVSEVYQQWRHDQGLPFVSPHTPLDVPE
ncbi:hypothetical protein FOYG_11644 [Fusarium oxysporum NRRL 32931]|uniref:Uncharacterized protein n=1 Tax=Fusarium oxysporum NRRL 32931 TaxID=660029 RepID=W9I3B6_FUSOX|nr:hypothetical protein FOYG_11644 [Fusarium oxysporum NRRL 32931]